MRRWFAPALVLVVAGLACGTSGDSLPAGIDVTVTTGAPIAPIEALTFVDAVRTTSGDASGNRVVTGTVALDRAPIAVSFGTPAAWIVGVAAEEGVLWIAVDQDGIVTSLLERDGAVAAVELGLDDLPPGMPPTIVASPDALDLVNPPDAAVHAGSMRAGDRTLAVTDADTLMIDGIELAGVAPLPDTRIVLSNDGLAALLTDPTDRLTHAVLGDAIEAETVTIVDPRSGIVVAVADAPDDTVFEAISPLWADVDGDGAQDLLVTASDRRDGARLVAYRSDGSLLAQSPPIGTGNRWLNQLGVASVGPRGELEIVEVRTPHIGGIVGWYRFVDGALVKVASTSGYSTHGIFSRNLDEGVIVDADGDGRLDVVVPTQDDTRLVVLSRTADGTEPTRVIELAAAPSSNLTAVTRPDGTATLALATEDGRLLIWP